MDQTEKDIFRKIEALLKRSASTNSEAEAATCAAKVQELLAKYNLDLQDLPSADQRHTTAIEQMNLDGGSERWQRSLLFAIAGGLFCKGVRYNNRTLFAVFGAPHNLKVVEYLNAHLRRELKKTHDAQWWWVRKQVQSKSVWSTSFYDGAVGAIARRLAAQREQPAATEEGARTYALVIQTDKLLEEAAQRVFTTITKGRISTRRSFDYDAFSLGREAGERVSLNPALTPGGRPRQLAQ